MPLKKMSKKELKLLNKSWITLGICKSIKRRESLYKKNIKAKNPESTVQPISFGPAIKHVNRNDVLIKKDSMYGAWPK